MVWVKICGIQNCDSIKWSEDSGADAIGFMFAKSKRRVSCEQVKELLDNSPTKLEKIGVFVNETSEKINEIGRLCTLDFVQLHGEETPEEILKISLPVIKVFRIKAESDLVQLKPYITDKKLKAKCPRLLLDTYVKGERGGTGERFDWHLAKKAAELINSFSVNKNSLQKIIVAGGLNPENVKEAVSQSGCFGVDVSSGVEISGDKNQRKIADFILSTKPETK